MTSGSPGDGAVDPQFAPRDLTDRRRRGEWETRYTPEAWKLIWREATYLALVLAAVALGILLVWLGRIADWLALDPNRASTFARYASAWLAGTLGGTLFAMKWLYHTVAKELWNQDRVLWRYFIPHISGGLAFGIVVVLTSVVLGEQASAISLGRATAIGFLVGLFSDNALAKLSEVAVTVLGTRSIESMDSPKGPRKIEAGENK